MASFPSCFAQRSIDKPAVEQRELQGRLAHSHHANADHNANADHMEAENAAFHIAVSLLCHMSTTKSVVASLHILSEKQAMLMAILMAVSDELFRIQLLAHLVIRNDACVCGQDESDRHTDMNCTPYALATDMASKTVDSALRKWMLCLRTLPFCCTQWFNVRHKDELDELKDLYEAQSEGADKLPRLSPIDFAKPIEGGLPIISNMPDEVQVDG